MMVSIKIEVEKEGVKQECRSNRDLVLGRCHFLSLRDTTPDLPHPLPSSCRPRRSSTGIGDRTQEFWLRTQIRWR